MAEESVFEYLARMRRVDTQIKNFGGRPDPKDHGLYLISQLEWRDGPSDDIGKRIEMELELREDDLTDQEKSLALEYFAEDYQRAQNSAVANFKMATRKEPSTEEHRTYLRKAGDLTRRATRDAQMARRLNPEVNVIMPQMDYQVIFDALQNFRDRLYFATEFPTYYEEIMPLHLRMKGAVKKEDYATAAKCRDGIQAIVSKPQSQ